MVFGPTGNVGQNIYAVTDTATSTEGQAVNRRFDVYFKKMAESMTPGSVQGQAKITFIYD